MSDFIKLFRRQKSVRQEVNQNDHWKRDSFQDANESYQPESTFYHRNDGKQRSDSLYDDAAQHEHEDVFKQPKSWRKSLRRLRWKKKEPRVSSSISSDNISTFPTQSTENIAHVTPTNPSKVNKRWSYSPDLSEDNVPGARELRGTLERKLSVKLEVEEKYNARSPSLSTQVANDRRSSSQMQGTPSDYPTYERRRDMSNSSFSQQNSVKSASGEVQDSPQLSASTTQIAKSDFQGQLTNMNGLSQSDPTFKNEQNQDLQFADKGNSSPGLVEWNSNKFNYQEGKQSSAWSNNPDGGPVYSQVQKNINHNTYNSKMLSADETPEEEEEPFDLQDIDDALTTVDSRSATLRSLHGQAYDHISHGAGYSHPDSALHSVTGSLMRGRAATQFERAADSVLENLEYPNYMGQADHYFQQLNDHRTGNRNEADSSENELRTTDTEDDIYENVGMEDARWDSQEFDSFSDTDDDDKYEEVSPETKTDSGVSKADRFSKDIGKLKFWDRSSVKKKNSSPAKPSESDSSTFLEVEILPKHHVVPQLPVLIPEDLTKTQRKRRNIVQQIVLSEQAYVDSLQRLETDYKQALLEHKPAIISSDLVEKVFYKISAILQCHRLFQMALAGTTTDWDSHESIGETFVASFSSSMVLECYGDFINNFTTAMDIVRKTCIRKPQFLAFLRERQTESPDRLNLYGLMLKPVQRFPQFIMFVQDLLKNTPSSHRDRLPLHLALTELETLAERLNHKKAEDEDAADLRNLLESSNLKLTSHTKDGRPRKLVKQAEVRECEHNEESLIEKMKDCLLILTNDMLVCCSISNRRPYQKSGYSTSKDMYKMKWRVHVDVVEVIDGSLRPSSLVEREALHADFIYLQQIGKLVGKLQLPHEGISSDIIDKCISSVETKIRQAEQLASQPENASFTVRFPSKSGMVVRTLVSSYASQKDEWLEAIFRAKLANSPENIDAWFSASSSDSDAAGMSPLFLRSMAAHCSYETLQVQCAHAFMPACHVTLLWLSCAASTVLSIISVYYITEDRVEKVHVMQVESLVQCMQHWNPFGDFNSVWLGMESGCLLEYSTAEGSYRKLSDVPMPTMSTVMIMEAHKSNLYVGLLDGTLAKYTRPKGTLDLYHVSSITVGTGPLVCLSPIDDQLWGCSGNNVVTIDIASFNTESSRSLVLQGESRVVRLVTRVGNGLWVNFCDECTLFLYHLDSLERLQEVNLSRVIRDFVLGLDPAEQISELCHVMSMRSGHSKLFVGMSNGLLLVMPLPKLPGSVPKITGPIKISRHSVISPLAFLFAPEVPSVHQQPDTPEEEPPVFDDNLPPPVPERDDLNDTGDTVVADGENNEQRRQSTNALTRIDPLSPRSPSTSANYRSPPVPPRPAPLRPTELALPEVGTSSSEMLPEDKTLYENMTLQSIESPRKLTFVHWKKDKKTRHCPVVIACGEGYRHFGSRSTGRSSAQESDVPTIICWKLV